jgi:hypothetical protein
MKECRLATLLLAGAICCYIVGVASFIGLIPASEPRIETLTTGTATLLANWLLLAPGLYPLRRADAQGLVPWSAASQPRRVTSDFRRPPPEPSPQPAPSKSIFEAAGLAASQPRHPAR